MDREKPKLGQILYSLNVGNAARRAEQVLIPVEVTKVGRKYFTCTEHGWRTGVQYYISDWGETGEYSANSHLYEDPEEWEREKEKMVIGSKIKELFTYNKWCNLTLDQLRRISEVIE